jgi:tetratricopeptide (TPR) repeat protein
MISYIREEIAESCRITDTVPPVNNSNASSRAAVKQAALALLQGNRLPEARNLYVALCQSDCMDAEAHYMLGVINGKLKQFADAADYFRKAITLQPQMAMSHYGLGASLKAQNRLAEAADCFREALRIQPEMAEVRFELASVLYSLGRLDEAKDNLQQAARIKPNPRAYHHLGNICSAQGLLSEAVTYYQHALKLGPGDADTHNKLGFTLYSLGRLEEAVENYRQALRLKPDFVGAHNNLGIVLTVQGRIDEAISCFQEALRIEPGSADAAFGILNAYEWVGDIQKAGEQLAPLIERYPGHVGAAQAFARLCKPLGRCAEAIDLIQKLLRQEGLAPIKKRQLHFSVGKLYDAMGSWDAAFAHYQSANSIQTPPYDPAIHARNIDAVISTFSADFLRHLPRATHVSDRPVFIVGMPRSGTSLVEQILASHPQVFGAGELGDIMQLVLSLPGYLDPAAGYPRCLHKLTQDATDTLARGYLDRLEKLSGGAARVTDKMPHNFLHLGIINTLFPGARVIHCMRDPLDTCLSIYFQYFNASHAYAYNLAHIGTHYREYKRLMAHWRQVLDIPMLEVRYEDIVTNPDKMIPGLIEFCGLEWDPGCLRFYENRRFVNTASYDQVRQPLHPKSIGRWKHYEKHLGPLKAALGSA